MRLSEFSATLHDYWRRWNEDPAETLPPFKVEQTQRLLRVRLVRIGSGINGGTLIYLEDLGRAQSEAQQIKLAALGRLTASIAHEVRNPLSAINQAAQDFRARFPNALGPNVSFTVDPMREVLVRNVRTTLVVLAGAVSFVLLPLTFLSGALMQQSLVPNWIETASRFNPVKSLETI